MRTKKGGINVYYCVKDGRTYPNECTLQSCIDWALWSVIHTRNEYGRYCEVHVCCADTGEVVYSIDTFTLEMYEQK